MDEVTIQKIDAAIEQAQEEKKSAARRVRRLNRLKESAAELEAVVSGTELPDEE